MRAGRMRSRVALQVLDDGQGADGSPVQTWTTIATLWASVTPVTGSERFVSAQTLASASHVVETRYQSALVPSMNPTARLLFGSRVLKINAVTDVDERNRMWRIFCKEEVPARG